MHVESEEENDNRNNLQVVKYVGKRTQAETLGMANLMKSKREIEKQKKMNIAPL